MRTGIQNELVICWDCVIVYQSRDHCGFLFDLRDLLVEDTEVQLLLKSLRVGSETVTACQWLLPPAWAVPSLLRQPTVCGEAVRMRVRVLCVCSSRSAKPERIAGSALYSNKELERVRSRRVWSFHHSLYLNQWQLIQGSLRVWKTWKDTIFWKSHIKSWNFKKLSKVMELFLRFFYGNPVIIIESLRVCFNEIWIKIHKYTRLYLKNHTFKKWQPFCSGFSVLYFVLEQVSFGWNTLVPASGGLEGQ